MEGGGEGFGRGDDHGWEGGGVDWDEDLCHLVVVQMVEIRQLCDWLHGWI